MSHFNFLFMKNLLFIGALCVLVLSSCGKKQTKQPLFDGYSLVGVEMKDGMKYGIQKDGKGLIMTIYDTIVYDEPLGLFLCTSAGSVDPINKDGQTMMYGSFTKIYKEGEWMRLDAENGFYLMDLKNRKRSVGKISDYGVDGEFVFTSADSLWGVVRKERFLRITDIEYRKVYIVNPHEIQDGSKIKQDFSIFALKKNGEWKMFDSNEDPFKISSAEIQKMVKKANPDKPYGVLKIDGLKW